MAMKKMTESKRAAMKRMSNQEGIIGALAIDQRGSLKKMIEAASRTEVGEEAIISFKEIVSRELTPYASAILLDPEYGLPAAKVRDQEAGLLVAYEKTGYDASEPGRLPDLLSDWSVKRLKEAGADAVKFLLYYDVDEPNEINEQKQVFMERIGSECDAEDLPFFLELVSYDAGITDVSSKEYAKIKPHKVIEMMKEFSKACYNVDVLKVEVPVNMAFVEGFGSDVCYSKEMAKQLFKEQSEATNLPFIFLSAGVSSELFQETLYFAKEAGSTFNGVLCGRATWKDGVIPFAQEGETAAEQWMRTVGKENIESLNRVLKETATPWMDR
ncbi:tagatose 1,6-diphosphate aldolase 2 [Enterococcus moraviensis ATCC BAA-383]|uniref:Tagatose 1,6-diphosphate aldolase n=2 Tax=Enterococcus moraviensis TaxID=155617 RepID=R2TCC7_9ENTE|nr:tagatose 1,6-diphosphate aldolase 2 [Enterococcus moraviensis ATCC BAA-383]EOT73929.1 tagatose 1,6-diphosphate aldolase 2 [Enterococcus moraviensis ATCC BAA-383]OJG66158.1 tagatose 1,6-diphosphate aldolase 2 [Enterococcus moraviensis]